VGAAKVTDELAIPVTIGQINTFKKNLGIAQYEAVFGSNAVDSDPQGFGIFFSEPKFDVNLNKNYFKTI
jgi:hypothetical protein